MKVEAQVVLFCLVTRLIQLASSLGEKWGVLFLTLATLCNTLHFTHCMTELASTVHLSYTLLCEFTLCVQNNTSCRGNRQTDRQNDRPSTTTLAAHERQGLKTM